VASKDQILKRMELYRLQGGGIGAWLTKETRDEVFARLGTLDTDPLRASDHQTITRLPSSRGSPLPAAHGSRVCVFARSTPRGTHAASVAAACLRLRALRASRPDVSH